MARTSITGYQRQYGSNGKSATPAVMLACIQFSFLASQASATVSKTLPKGAIPLFVQNIDGAGSAGTANVGTSGDPNGFANELDADAITGLTNTGVLLGVELTADTIIFAGIGTAGAGTIKAAVYYIMSDDGSA